MLIELWLIRDISLAILLKKIKGFATMIYIKQGKLAKVLGTFRDLKPNLP
jgi:hypothetical protein